jgi:hypothetical protein
MSRRSTPGQSNARGTTYPVRMVRLRPPDDFPAPPNDSRASRDYRVEFYEWPFPDSPETRQQEMAWAYFVVDISDVADVQDALSWAENNYREYSPYAGEPVYQRAYVLYVRARDDSLVQISGRDPSKNPELPSEHNLDRLRPLPPD